MTRMNRRGHRAAILLIGPAVRWRRAYQLRRRPVRRRTAPVRCGADGPPTGHRRPGGQPLHLRMRPSAGPTARCPFALGSARCPPRRAGGAGRRRRL